MNRYKKAAEFGAMMGKVASNPLRSPDTNIQEGSGDVSTKPNGGVLGGFGPPGAANGPVNNIGGIGGALGGIGRTGIGGIIGGLMGGKKPLPPNKKQPAKPPMPEIGKIAGYIPVEDSSRGTILATLLGAGSAGIYDQFSGIDRPRGERYTRMALGAALGGLGRLAQIKAIEAYNGSSKKTQENSVLGAVAPALNKLGSLDPSTANAIGLGGLGALAGGAVGGLGALAGGEDESDEPELDGMGRTKRDSKGRIKFVKNKPSVLGGALTGSLIGGGLGGLAGYGGTELARTTLANATMAPKDNASLIDKAKAMAQQVYYNNSSRADQFKQISKEYPFITDNAFTEPANLLHNWFTGKK